VPALQNEDKTTWAAGVTASLKDGLMLGIEGLYSAEIAGEIAHAIGYFYAKSLGDAVALIWELPIGLGQMLINAITKERESVDLSPALKWMMDVGKDLIDGLIAGITNSKIGEWITTFFENFIKSIKLVFGIESPSTVMAGIGADLVAGLKDGIVEASRDFYDWIVGWAKRIIPQPLWKFFGIESPSKLMAEMGRNLVLGLAQGIQQTGPVAASAMAGVMGGFGTPNLGAMRLSPAYASGASGGSLSGTGFSITNNIYTNGGSADAVRTAANTGTLEALRARGYR
jgi:hypothetical protein